MASGTAANVHHALEPVKVLGKASAKAAHVNMMTDTIIANMPPEGLRTILRGILGVDPKVTPKLNELAKAFLNATRPVSFPQLFESGKSPSATPALLEIQQRYRCLMGCGMGFASMDLLVEVIRQFQEVVFLEGKGISEALMDTLAIVDADIVQSLTAVQKELLTRSGIRKMSRQETEVIVSLANRLIEIKQQASRLGKDFAFNRGLSRIQKIEGVSGLEISQQESKIVARTIPAVDAGPIEYFQLGTSTVPRMFMGTCFGALWVLYSDSWVVLPPSSTLFTYSSRNILTELVGLWQFSSPAWGTASTTKINKDFRKHVDAGLTAYGK